MSGSNSKAVPVTVIIGIKCQSLLQRLHTLAGHDLDRMTLNDLHQTIVADSKVVPQTGHGWLLLQSHAIAANTRTHIHVNSDKFLMEIHFRTAGCRLPYGITQYYLPPNTSEHTLNHSQ